MPERTDKELLELAAKAARIDLVGGRDCTGMPPAMNHLSAQIWNPLTDDGDRYRLAKRLGLVVDFEDCEVRYWDDHGCNYFEFGDEGDAYAVLRAAAEIGANMQS